MRTITFYWLNLIANIKVIKSDYDFPIMYWGIILAFTLISAILGQIM